MKNKAAERPLPYLIPILSAALAMATLIHLEASPEELTLHERVAGECASVAQPVPE